MARRLLPPVILACAVLNLLAVFAGAASFDNVLKPLTTVLIAVLAATGIGADARYRHASWPVSCARWPGMCS